MGDVTSANRVRLYSLAASLAGDLIGLGGVFALVRGVALISEAAAWIVAGLLMIVAAVLLARRGSGA